jgi:hypothetical protein
LSHEFARKTATSPKTTAKAIMTTVLVRTTYSLLDAELFFVSPAGWYAGGMKLVKLRSVLGLC